MNSAYKDVDQKEYNRRIWAWTMYDWANSAFATTILAAVLPVYYSQVAGANLPTETVATSYWSTGLSLSLFIIAIFSPILGTISDVMRGKKRFLAVFAGIGIVATGLLVLVSTGDWLLASILFILGRIGFSGANVFYDALLPHIASDQDRDRVSTRGYAMGYLGGGILLAINVLMINFLGGEWGSRLSFLSVGIWWAVFSIPLFMRIPEPPAAVVVLKKGQNVISVSFRRIWDTILDIRQYRELFKYLVAFFIYNDGIGTIIGVAVIYGAELGFGSTELILALLLVQFVGIPYSLIFGRLPSKDEKRRPIFLAFILYNIIALPLLGLLGARLLPGEVTGRMPESYSTSGQFVGQGSYLAGDASIAYQGDWEITTVPADVLGTDEDQDYALSNLPGSAFEFRFNGQNLTITFSQSDEHGIWNVYLDDQPLVDQEGVEIQIDGYNATRRYEVQQALEIPVPGEHVLRIENSDQKNPQSVGSLIAISGIEVLSPTPESNLLYILGLILVVELLGILLAVLLGGLLFSGVVKKIDTKQAIQLALFVYIIVAIWGFFLNSVLEFWALAWMVAIVQGGSQALSRSLYSSMSPASKSGEFFGLYGIMEKFSAVLGPLMFAAAGVYFGSSRPAVLTLILLFVIGGAILMFVNVEEGRRVAKEEDAHFLGEAGAD
jgi:UMF1 family MFS transporter